MAKKFFPTVTESRMKQDCLLI